MKACAILIILCCCCLITQKTLPNTPEQIIFCTIEQANTLFEQEQHQQALQQLLQCAKQQQQDSMSLAFADLYYKIGKGYYNIDQSDSALYYLHKAFERQKQLIGNEHGDTQYTHYVISVVNESIGNYAVAIAIVQELVQLEKQQKAPKVTVLADYYRLLGRLSTDFGDFSQAVQYFNQAINVNPHSKPDFIAGCHLGQSVAYSYTQQYDIALEKLLKAHDLYLQINDQENYLTCLNSLSILYRRQKNYAQALAYSRKALLISQKDPQRRLAVAQNYTSISKIQKALHQYDDALLSLQKAIDIYEQKLPYTKPKIVVCYDGIGDIYYEQQQDSAALKAYDKSIAYLLNTPDSLPTNQQQHLNIRNTIIEDPFSLSIVLASKVKTLYQIAQKNPQSNLLAIAYNTAITTDSLIAFNQQNIRSEESIIQYNQKITAFYETAIQIALQRNQPQEAFLFAEKAKAFVLRSFLQNNKALQFANIPTSIIQQDNLFIQQIAHTKSQIIDQPDNKALQDSLFQYDQQRFKFIEQLEREYPTYYQLKYDQHLPNVEQLQQQLSNDQALIDYFVANEHYYVFAITQHSFKIYPYLKNPDFSDCLAQLLQSAQQLNPTEQYPNLAYYWYDLLISDIAKQLPNNIKRLLIIPDAELGYLPFDLLVEQPLLQWHPPNTETPAWQDINMPLLLKKFAISYRYTTLQMFKAEPSDATKQSYSHVISFGIDYKDSAMLAQINHSLQQGSQRIALRQSLGQLPNAPIEASTVAQLMNGKAYLNRQATISNFWEAAQQQGILHLAMHGIIDDENPLNSKLVFSHTDKANSSYLTAADLYGQQLNAGMTVLSACNSGSGNLQHSEGIMSLARAFTFAGCPSLVMSLWSLADEPTAIIMNHFYQFLKKGLSKDVALQQAKLQYFIHQGFSTRTPLNWSSFVIIGDTNPIATQTTSDYWKYAAIFLALFFFVILFYRLKQKAITDPPL